MPVDVNVIVGCSSMSKKSFVRRWPSRPSSPVSIDAICTVAVSVDSSGFSAVTMSALKSPKRPRTFDTIMWRTVKPTELWAVSNVQVPAGMVVVVVLSLMGCMLAGRS